MPKKSIPDLKTVPLIAKPKGARPPIATPFKAKDVVATKPSALPKRVKANKTVQTTRQEVANEDPFLGALAAHEREIARLGAVILDLRGQQVSWINATIEPLSCPEIAPPVDVSGADQDEINRLTTALSQAWAELETKQSYLQSAVDNGATLQATLDVTLEQSAQLTLENQALTQQLHVTERRLSIALEIIARHGHA